MDVERRGMDYHISLTELDINVLCGYSNPNHSVLPLVVKVQGPIEEIFSLSCDNSRNFRDTPGVVDEVLFERGKKGPEIVVSPHAFTQLLGSREFWVTRYDWENKIWIRRDKETSNGEINSEAKKAALRG